MNTQQFQLLADLLKKRSGLTLTEDKIYLIESRLLPIARGQELADLDALWDVVAGYPSEELLVEITEAMTTNESSFFRDIKPYEHLKTIVWPVLMDKLKDNRHMRMWSAACSTGQEPYSVAMALQEEGMKMAGWTFDIVATDLANKVIEKAKQGIYSQFEAQRGLPIQMLVKYFTAQPDTSWQLKDTIRSMVQFKQQNLLTDYAHLGKFDIIFCRNVFIYFDEATKAKITEKMARALQPHGVLILGSTESIVDAKAQFKSLEGFRGAYVLR